MKMNKIKKERYKEKEEKREQETWEGKYKANRRTEVGKTWRIK
jgi:hypothetical protein